MKIQRVSSFPLFHDKCQGYKKPSRHFIYVMHFALVWLTSYFLRNKRKMEIERSETVAKSLVTGQSPLKLNVFL